MGVNIVACRPLTRLAARAEARCPRPQGLALASLLVALAFASWANDAEQAAIEQWRMGDDAVFLLEDRRTPLVDVRIEFPIGMWSAWAQESNAADAFAIQTHDPERRLLARADRLGVELNIGMGAVSAWLQANCLAEDTPALIELMRDVLANRDFDTAELRRRHRQRDLAWNASSKDPRFVLTQASTGLLLIEGDPRRRPWEEPTTGSTRRARLLAARDAVVRLPGRTIAMSGSISRTELEPMLADLLPSSESPGEGFPVINNHDTLQPLRPAEDRPSTHTEALPRLTQVYLALVRDGLPIQHADQAAYRIANHVLTGHFYSRMYVALRHDAGETYTVNASDYGTIHRPRVYILQTYTRTANADRTERILQDTLATFHAGGITEQERQEALGNLAGRRLFARQTPRQVLAEQLTERRLGLPAGLFADLPTQAAKLTLADINAFITHFYNPQEFSLVRIEPED